MQASSIAHYTADIDARTPEELDALFQEAARYNQTLQSNNSSAGSVTSPADPFQATASIPGYDEKLKIADAALMGVLELPSIGITLPIYHGVDGATLRKGVGHVPNSALPIGGNGANPVLVGQRNSSHAVLFSNLDHVMVDDIVNLRVLDQTYSYQVDQVRVVAPEDTTLYAALPGQDRVTLVTDAPARGSSHRLVVRAHRIDPVAATTGWLDANTRQLLVAAAILSAAGGGYVLWRALARCKEAEDRRETKIFVHRTPHASLT